MAAICICGHKDHVHFNSLGCDLCSCLNFLQLKEPIVGIPVGRPHSEEPTVQFAGGNVRSKKPRYALISKSAIDAYADRCELGLEKHGDKSWNNLSPDKDSKVTKDWVIASLEHVISHALIAIQKISGSPDDGDDDAGAILFGGGVLAEWSRIQKEKK